MYFVLYHVQETGQLLGKRKKESRSSVEHPSIVHECMLEGSVSTVVLDKGMERAESWQTGAGEGSHWRCRKLSKTVLHLGVLFFSDFL